MKILSKLAAYIGAAAPTYWGKPGARAYAVGDVHGCVKHLASLLALIEADLVSFKGSVYLIFLGDLIDRGPDSRGVVDLLSRYAPKGVQPVFLMGNHEEFLLRAIAGEPNVINRWMSHGGAECVRSYGLDPEALRGIDEITAAKMLRSAIPADHINFISTFVDTFAFGEYVFVHAGIRPGLALDQQDYADLRWIREPFLSHHGSHGFMVVHGHTVGEEVEERDNRIGIDTGAYRGGALTALIVENETRRYISTGGQAQMSLSYATRI